MTASRIVRGTKGRIFLYVCALLIFTGILACYHNLRVHLDDVQKTNDQCHQNQENLSSQLQVIFEYKQRLEKSLNTEKAEHLQTKADQEVKLKEQESQHEKVVSENKLRFTSLQQQYKLLERQFNDFKEEASKIQQDQLDEINSLQAKLKEVQQALKQVDRDLVNEKEKLQKRLKNSLTENELAVQKNHDLKAELDKLKVQQGKGVYVIQKKPEDVPKANVEEETNQMAAPKAIDKAPNPNNSQRVLPMPYINRQFAFVKSSTSKSSDLDGVKPLGMPTSTTPESKKSSSSKSAGHVLAVPQGIVPVPKQHLNSKEEKSAGLEETNAALPGRYRNNILGVDFETPQKDANDKGFSNDIGDRENGAQEIVDPQLNDKQQDGDVGQEKLHMLQHKLKQHIDALAMAEEFDKNDPEEEQGDDDDADEYGNHYRHKDPAVRN